MTSLPFRGFASFAPAGRYGPPAKLRHLISSRPSRLLLGCLLCLVCLLLFGFPGHYSSARKGRFSLLVPATSSNVDLCKLLLSAQILNYPTPVLINYGATEFEDAYVQHLAKVEGILKYLEALEASDEYGEDLVLIVDGYDVWFQLHADTLLKRYYEINARANADLVRTYGRSVVRQNDMRQTIVFGPDKICWPIDYSRPACWAVPVGTLPEWAFGPETATELQSRSQPRWLNSGTILGPASDLKALFRETLDMINNANNSIVSDQYYLAEVFGRQEWARLSHKPSLMQEYKEIKYAEELFYEDYGPVTRADADLTGVSKTEFHIGIDYDSKIFQTLAFWKQFLAFMRPADSWDQQPTQPYQFPLSADVANSEKPFARLPKDSKNKDEIGKPWSQIELLYNTISQVAPAMIHFTGEKRFRHIWWKKMWYQAKAKELREASLAQTREHDAPYGPIGGYMFHNAEPLEAEEVRMHGVGGAWSDRGGWFSWKSLCRPFEEQMYSIPDEEFFHPAPQVQPAQDVASGLMDFLKRKKEQAFGG